VVVSAPTGAGKTYIFELLHQARHLQGQAIYTVPTRALANDKYAEWKDAKWNVGIATGDIAENVDAPVVVATLETQLERLVRGEGPALLVIDEYQMISDHRAERIMKRPSRWHRGDTVAAAQRLGGESGGCGGVAAFLESPGRRSF
jgi:replicative superfamily II helicase